MAELHAHIESRTVDCDGALDRLHTETMSTTERMDEYGGEYDFRYRILAHVVNTQPMHTGQLEVVTFDDGTSRLSWHEATDEGYRQVEATFCTDEDCDMGSSQRDHRAEAAGY